MHNQTFSLVDKPNLSLVENATFYWWRIGKIAIFSIKLTSNLTNWVENSEKLEFSAKQVRIFRIFNSAKIIGGSVIAQKVKYLGYHRKNSCGHKLLNEYYTYNHNHCRKHQKFAKLSIQHNRKYQAQNCEKFSPIVTQNWHFLKCQGYRSTNKYKLLLRKNIKAAIDCSYTYCEGNHNKVLQTHAFFLQMHTLVLIGVIKQINIFTQNINYINYLQNNITTKT